MESLGFVLIQGVLGAFSGYITNTYAVNMLFKEYTPLKLGGVVKKNKEKFIDEISSLVEKDIINGNTLKDNIESDDFKEALRKVCYDFFNKYLPENIEGKRIKEISGYNETRKHLESYINSNFKDVFFNVCDNALENFTLEDIFKKEYINEISESLYILLLKEFENNKELKEIIYDLYNENTYLSLNMVLSENSKLFIKNNIEEITKNSLSKLINDDERLKEFLDKVYKCLNIEDVIDNFQISLKKKSISEIFTESDIKNLSHDLYEYINEYLNSEKGFNFFLDLINKIIDTLKNIDSSLYSVIKSKDNSSLENRQNLKETAITLYDIIPEKFEDSIFEFINKSLIEFLPYIAEWIKINEENFNALIEESIDEGIKDLDEGAKKKIVEMLRKYLLSDVASSSDMIGKALNYIDDDNTKEDVSRELTEKLINFLKETKIKDLIKKIESSNLLKDDKLNKIVTSLQNSFSKK